MSRGYSDCSRKPSNFDGRLFAYLVALAFVIVGLLVLGSCAADGSFASKDKPVDKVASIAASCKAAVLLNTTFLALAKDEPGVVGPEFMAIEAILLETVGLHVDETLPVTPKSACAKDYPGDLAVAETAVLTVIVQLPALLAKWRH